jgi:tRNA A-37 threonylcarbamoyl transferase component Bud32
LIRIVSSWLSVVYIEEISPSFTQGNNADCHHCQRMLDGSIAKPFKDKRHNYVYQLDTPNGTHYLKRTDYQSPRSILRHLLRMRRAHVDCVWEYLAIRALQDHGFSVMVPVAWGEEFWLWFWPRRGFLLVKQVAGDELVDIFSGQIDSALRRDACRAYGHYLGRLHGNGFFHPARVHDFIFKQCKNHDNNPLELTMIDVDLKGLLPTPYPFDHGRSIKALAESCYLFLRVGHRVSRDEAHRFMRGYQTGLSSCGEHLKSGTLTVLTAEINRLLDEHQKNPGLIKILPESPSIYRSNRNPSD